MKEYLEPSEFIDWKTPKVLAQAISLSRGSDNVEEIAKRCFEFVRDNIKHSFDFKLNPVTCKASDVLLHGTGYCYAKSHLLAALLRANNIPAALCYQRLTISGDVPPFCLHGLNAVYLQAYGWFRVDARGNKKGVLASFCPPNEVLAFPFLTDGECDLPLRYSHPLPEVIACLTSSKTYLDVAERLPDLEIENVSPLINGTL